jgi:hypothetical protein
VNNRRLDTVSSLILLVIVVVCVVGIGRYYVVTREIDRIEAEDARRVIGSDRVLLETVENLENTLNERITYQFMSDSDPLDLTKVVTSQAFLRKIGADKQDPDAQIMRLAATVVGDDGSATAVIRYLGTGHILRVGDLLEGWKITEIGQEEVVMVRRGERQVLVNRPIRESLQATGLMLSVRPVRNDDWQSMYINVGFPGDVLPSEPVEDTPEAVPAETSGQTAPTEEDSGTEAEETPVDTTQDGNG